MAKQKTKKRSAEYDYLSLGVSSYAASVDASVNFRVRDRRHYEDDAQFFDFHSRLEIECCSWWPDNRAGCNYSLTIYGHAPQHEPFSMTLEDCQVRDEFGERKYEKRRGEQVPVYRVPKGVGHLDRVRGANAWSGVAWVAAQCLTDMLTLLPVVSPLYVSIHELREGRNRFIVGLILQTTDPTED